MRQLLLAALAGLAGAVLGAAALWVPEPSFDEDVEALAHEPADAAPRWRVGDAWRVQFAEGDPACWLVVVAADAEGYRQGVWCPSGEAPLIATQLATMGTPYAGVLRADLTGVGRDDEVRWFDWPLEDGKAWSTRAFGRPVRVEATATGGGAFALEMMDDASQTIALYDYSPSLRWWSALELPATGFVFRVHERETAWSAGATEARADLAVAYTRSLAGLVPASLFSQLFGVDERHDVVAVEVQRQGAYVHRLELVDPNGATRWSDDRTSFVNADSYVWAMVDASPGGWGLRDTAVPVGLLSVRAWAVEIVEHA